MAMGALEWAQLFPEGPEYLPGHGAPAKHEKSPRDLAYQHELISRFFFSYEEMADALINLMAHEEALA